MCRLCFAGLLKFFVVVFLFCHEKLSRGIDKCWKLRGVNVFQEENFLVGALPSCLFDGVGLRLTKRLFKLTRYWWSSDRSRINLNELLLLNLNAPTLLDRSDIDLPLSTGACFGSILDWWKHTYLVILLIHSDIDPRPMGNTCQIRDQSSSVLPKKVVSDGSQTNLYYLTSVANLDCK